MLHRLLTLPSQLLEGDEESMEAPPIFLEAPTDSSETALAATSPRLASPPALMAEEEEEEEEEEVVAAEEEEDRPWLNRAACSQRLSRPWASCG